MRVVQLDERGDRREMPIGPAVVPQEEVAHHDNRLSVEEVRDHDERDSLERMMRSAVVGGPSFAENAGLSDVAARSHMNA